MSEPSLPDRPCQPGGVLLVGINPAPPSVAAGHYYQGRLGQRLWARLRGLGLLKDAGRWEDDAFVAAGNGLTDLVKRPTASADMLDAGELAAGLSGLVAKVRDWRPGLLLFAFRPPAEAILGRDVVPGRGPDFAGARTFLLSGPYAAVGIRTANDSELRLLLDGNSAHDPPVVFWYQGIQEVLEIDPADKSCAGLPPGEVAP